MNLLENMRILLDLYGNPQKPGEWEIAEKAVEEALIHCQNTGEIKQLIKLDSVLVLSDPVRRLAFEKLLDMGDRTWQTLGGYASQLSMYRREDSEERLMNQLFEEANRLKREEEQRRKDDDSEAN